MLDSFKFGRFDRSSKEPNLSYSNPLTGNDAQMDKASLLMQEAGYHWNVSIKNHLNSDVLLVTSLHGEPQRIPSIQVGNVSTYEILDHYVIVELRQRTRGFDKTRQLQTIEQKSIRIKCPGYLLEKGTLYIEELGFYITLDAQLSVTRELIAHEARMGSTTEISVPAGMVKENPRAIFKDFERFLRNCVERSDKIMVNVGHKVDGDPEQVPDYVKSLRIAVGDRDFVPYTSGQMQYDNRLGPDQFVVKNMLYSTDRAFPYSFSELHETPTQTLVVDHTEHRTMEGDLYGLVLFANTTAFVDYLHAHRSEQLYAELSNRLIEKNGDVVVRKQLDYSQRSVGQLEERIRELESSLKAEQERAKQQKRTITLQEETIQRLVAGEERVSHFDRLMLEQENIRKRLELDNEKIRQERDELALKARTADKTHKANTLKTFADMLKSTWGILAIAATACVAIYKGWNKLKTTTA